MPTPPRRVPCLLSSTPYRVLARLLAACMLGLGGAVLIGWSLRAHGVTNIRDRWFSMNPLTATCFCVAGFLVALSGSERRRRFAPFALLAGSTFLIVVGLGGLVRDVVGVDPGLDLILFAGRLDDGVRAPSRLSSNTAYGFLLVGTALFLLRRPRVRIPSLVAILSAAAFVLGLLGVIGYAIGAPSLAPGASLYVMALHTAAGFILAGGGTLLVLVARVLAEPDPPRVLPSIPSRWSITSVHHIGGVGFAIALVSLTVLGVVSSQSLGSVLVRARYNLNARQTLEDLHELDAAVQSLQTASYRYLLANSGEQTDDPAARAYRTAQAAVWNALDTLGRSPSLAELPVLPEGGLGSVRVLVRRHTERVAELRARTAHHPLNTAVLASPEFAQPLQQVRGSISLIANQQTAAVIHRRDSILGTMRGTELVISVGSALSVLVVGGTAWLLRRVTTDLRHTQDEAAKLSLVASQTRNMVIITDAAGRIEWANASFARLTGYALAEVEGKRSTELLHVPMTDPDVAVDIGDHLVRGEAFSGEVVRYTKSGRPLRLTIDIHPIHNDHGVLVNFVWIEHDITEARREQESLSFLAAIVRCSEDAIISEDLSGRITSWNAGAERLLGYHAEDVIGKPVSVLAPPDRAAEVPGLLRRLRSGEHINHFETVRRTKDGRRIDVALTLSPIRGQRGEVIGFSKIARDITERKRAEAELREARAAAEAASRSKSEFLAHMSHEIRTPLNGVVGMIDLLMGTPPMLTEQQFGYGQLAKSSAESLTKIVNDILDFSKIEAGKLDIVPDDFHLHALCEEVVELLRPKAAEKNVEMACAIEQGVPDEVCADPDRLRQVLVNLVNNAVKFTKKGRVTLRVSPESHVGKRATLRFEVVDTGIGIPQSRLDRLFKAFSQADSSTTRVFGGTGLGLAISKQLVELMGGSIGVASNVGEGSTFWFTVGVECRTARKAPAASPVPAAPSSAALPPSSGQPSPAAPRILLAEDNDINQIVAREILTKAGFACDIVADGWAAVEAVEQGRYDLVLMDCEMPVMDGFEATRQIRDRERARNLPRLPIVALTANAMTADRQQCLDVGMDAYVCKPIDVRELLETIHKHIQEKQPLTQAA